MQELIWNRADVLKHAVFQIPSHQMSDEASLGSGVCHRSRGQTAETRLVTANLSLSLAFLEFKQSDKRVTSTSWGSIALNILGKTFAKMDIILALMIKSSVFPAN